MTRPVLDEDLEMWMERAVEEGLVGVDIYPDVAQFGLTPLGAAMFAELESRARGEAWAKANGQGDGKTDARGH